MSTQKIDIDFAQRGTGGMELEQKCEGCGRVEDLYYWGFHADEALHLTCRSCWRHMIAKVP